MYLRTKETNTCRKAVKNTTIIVIYKVLVYIQISANYMFRPLLVRPSSSWIPSPRKYSDTSANEDNSFRNNVH